MVCLLLVYCLVYVVVCNFCFGLCVFSSLLIVWVCRFGCYLILDGL